MRDRWTHTELGVHIDLLTGYPFKSSEYSKDGLGIRLLRGDNVIQGLIRWDDACYSECVNGNETPGCRN
jgi:type I restriction enzyme S subunit